jgi:hypothetical protein
MWYVSKASFLCNLRGIGFRYVALICMLKVSKSASRRRIGNSNAILPMTTVASAGAYLLSTLVELGPNNLLSDKYVAISNIA